MNAGNVAAFGCGRAHPQLGDSVPCVRQRHHGGDHRAEHDGKLKVWADPATPWDVPGVRTLVGDDLEPLPVDTFGERGGPVIVDPVPGELDEQAETWLEARGTGGVWLWIDDVTRAAVLAVLVAVILSAPAVLQLLYEAAY